MSYKMQSLIYFAIFLAMIMLPGGAAILDKKENRTNDDALTMVNDQGIADGEIEMGCIDWKNNLVADGEMYVPNGNDMCLRCTCDKHFPIRCHSVACSPPLNCASPQPVKGACCEYICLDDGLTNDGNVTRGGGDTGDEDGESITNLSLRLIASTVTSFLVLALLLFMVHRLRQRRLLLAMRRFEARARQGHPDDTDSEPYIPDAFISLECPPYTDPPPPYSPPKPPHILPGEQPPPYDEINNGEATVNRPDENRNEISRGGCENGSSNPGQGAQGASSTNGRSSDIWRGSLARNLPNTGGDSIRQAELQRRSYDQSQSSSIPPPNALSAYASTDVVEGLGVVISPGSDIVSYTPGWNTWQMRGMEEDRVNAVPQRENIHHRRALSSGDPPRAPNHTSNTRVQSVPTTTAFQRFSSIFKRDSWKAKHRRRHGRPASEYSTPPHYATVPRSELGSTPCNSNVRYSGGDSNNYRRRFPNRMCMSYDSAQAAYTLDAISPSTSSSTSSNSPEPYDHHHHHHISNTPTTATTTHSNSSSISPPSGDPLRQQFRDDLRRHLPPLQLPDVQESVSPVHGSEEGTHSIYSSHLRDLEMDSTRPLSTNTDNQSSANIGNCDTQADSIQRSRMETQSSISQSHVSSSSSDPNRGAPHQQSLASFIMSHPASGNSEGAQRHSGRDAISTQTPSESAQASTRATSNMFCDSVSRTLPNMPASSSQRNYSLSNGGRGILSHSAAVPVSQSHSASIVQEPATSSTSPSPSPPVQHNDSAMRRSQSGASQASMFSVCSETGEKKLKLNESLEDDTKAISADSQYPEFHSLPKSRPRLTVPDSSNMGTFRSHAQPSSETAVTGISEQHENTEYNDQNRICVPQVGQNMTCPDYSLNRVCSDDTAEILNGASFQNSAVPVYPFCDNQLGLPTPEASDYNFNTAPVHKTIPSKDLSPCEDARMTQSVNIPPLPPFVTAQSGKLIPGQSPKHSLSAVPTSDSPVSQLRPGKNTEGAKKAKKKRGKERNSFSGAPQGNVSKPRQSSSSPKRVFVNIGERSKDNSMVQKGEGGSRDISGGGKWLKMGEKKYRVHSGPNRQPVRLSDPANGNKLMTRSAEDAAALYGNADVYRGAGGDGMGASMSQSFHYPQYFEPWRQNTKLGPCDLSLDLGTGLNDLNQPPNYLKTVALDKSNNYISLGAEGAGGVKLDQSSQPRRRNHKRQSFASDKPSHVPSPNRHKTRPKSMAAPDTQVHEKWGDPSLSRPSVATGDVGNVGKGARSGFGRDLNFDDQAGLAEFHTQDIDFTPRKLSGGQDSQIPVQAGQSVSSKKGTDPATNSVPKMGTSSGSRSGLSHDLSFTSRPALTTNPIKKRQSLPAIVSGLTNSGLQDRQSTVTPGGAGARSRLMEEGHVQGVQVRGERSGYPIDRRQERAIAVNDDYSEATSYV